MSEISNQSSSERLVAEVRKQVDANLNLDEGLSRYRPETRKKVAGVISQTIAESAQDLDLKDRLPEIGLRWGFQREDVVMVEETSGIKVEIPAIFKHPNEKNPNGAINFDPVYLRMIAHWIENPSDMDRAAGYARKETIKRTSTAERFASYYWHVFKYHLVALSAPEQLRCMTAHEMYHAHQYYSDPEGAGRDDGILERRGGKLRKNQDKWLQSEKELAAQQYAFLCARNHREPGVREWASKFVGLIGFGILLRRQRRVVEEAQAKSQPKDQDAVTV
ncbi:hypothetical protein ACFLZP_04305 [Patescibacteria group bacterium]